MKIKEAGLITKQEVLKQLKRYGIEIKSRTLAYYIAEKLIEPPIKKGMPGITGSVSFFKEQTPLIIVGLEKLNKKYGLALKEISKYRSIVYNFDQKELIKYLAEPKKNETELKQQLTRLENIRFFMVLNHYACAEAGYQYDYENGGFTIEGKRILVVNFHEIKEGKLVELHVELKVAAPGKIKSLSDLPDFKEVIYSRKGIEII